MAKYQLDVTIGADLILLAAHAINEYFKDCSNPNHTSERIKDIEVSFDPERECIILYDDATQTERTYSY